MLSNIDCSFNLLTKRESATKEQIDSLLTHFGVVPNEYLELVCEATEIELQHIGGQYVRIWGPTGCIDMDDGYEIRKRIPNAFPIGDDGGGHVIFYANGNNGSGLYHVGYGNLDLEDAVWIASSLNEFLTIAAGIETF